MHEEDVAGLVQGLIAAQQMALLAQTILEELVLDMARQQPDPGWWVRDIHGRVASRLDPNGSEKVVVAGARQSADKIFVAALARLGPGGGAAGNR